MKLKFSFKNGMVQESQVTVHEISRWSNGKLKFLIGKSDGGVWFRLMSMSMVNDSFWFEGFGGVNYSCLVEEIKQHDLVTDRANNGSERLTCKICKKQVLDSPFMSQLQWGAMRDAFRALHGDVE